MLRRLTLPLACWLLCAHAATAKPIQLTCRVVIETTGELEQRSIRIDPEARVVQDNAMTFTDGATSSLAASVEEFVTVEGRRVTWGNRTKLDRRMVGTFTIDLVTGGYTLVTRSMGQFSRGTCQKADPTI